MRRDDTAYMGYRYTQNKNVSNSTTTNITIQDTPVQNRRSTASSGEVPSKTIKSRHSHNMTMGKASEIWRKIKESDTEFNIKVDRVLIPLMFIGYACVIVYFCI